MSIKNYFNRKRLLTAFPHIEYPAVMKAQVTSMAKTGDRTWTYSIKPLRSDLSASEFPEIPDVKSHVEVEAGVGGIVAVALLYGQLDPIIIDEVIP